MSVVVPDWRTSPLWQAVNHLYIDADNRWWENAERHERFEIAGEIRAYGRVLDLLEGNDRA